MDWQQRIEVDPGRLAGKPVVAGTRIAVELVLELLAAGMAEDELLAEYPGLTIQDLHACRAFPPS